MKHARADYNRIQDPAGLIPEDEPVFLLRGQDPFAANTVRHYITLLRANGVADKFIEMCIDQAQDMEDWPKKLGSPDLPKEETPDTNVDVKEVSQD